MIDGTWAWRQLAPATPPGVRYAHAMAWDGSRALLFGGWSGSAALDDTWELVGDEWDELSPSTVPGARQFAHMVWDGSRFLMYGGGSVSDLNDLWEYTGGDWNELAPANVPPDYNSVTQPGITASILASQLVWDGTRALILYPSYDPVNGTHLWQYTSGDWSHANPTDEYGEAATPASARDRWYTPLVWAGDRLVSGGGEWNTHQSFNDTEEYDGTTWTETVLNGGAGWSHRSRMRMVWTGEEVFMFGGMTGTVGTVGEPCANDSWIYNTGTSVWTDLSFLLGGTRPSARQWSDMVWDGQRVVLYGGIGNGGLPNDETWVLEPPHPPDRFGVRVTTYPHIVPLGNAHVHLH